MANINSADLKNDPIVSMTVSMRYTKKKRMSDWVGNDKKHSNKSELVNAAVDYYVKKNLHLK